MARDEGIRGEESMCLTRVTTCAEREGEDGSEGEEEGRS